MAKNTSKPWTEEEIQLLKKFLNDGMTAKEISKRLKRSEGSIYIRIHKLKYSNYQNSDFKINGKWSEEEVQLLKKYLDEGMSHKEIALKLNRTLEGVRNKINYINYIKSNNLYNQKEWTTKEQELLLQYYKEGLTNKEISEKLGRSIPSTVCKLKVLLNKTNYHIMTEYAKNRNNTSRNHATNHRKSWTKEEDSKLKGYIEKGYSYENIAEILGRTIESIKRRYLRHIREDKND